MKVVKINNSKQIPKNYTGIIDFLGSKYWYKNGKQHREDGSACELYSGKKHYFLNNREIKEKSLLSFLVLTFVKNGKKIPEIYFK